MANLCKNKLSYNETNNNRFLPYGRNDIVICFIYIKSDSEKFSAEVYFLNAEPFASSKYAKLPEEAYFKLIIIPFSR